jgi:hypothetical protein
VRTGLAVVALLLARDFASPILELLQAHTGIGVVLFAATSALAVLLSMLSNLPLVPLAVLAWGP